MAAPAFCLESFQAAFRKEIKVESGRLSELKSGAERLETEDSWSLQGTEPESRNTESLQRKFSRGPVIHTSKQPREEEEGTSTQ